MERFIAVDAGKGSTKVAYYTQNYKTAKAVLFRTKVSEGDLRDDALEQGTVLMEYNGVTYKIGNGATREATQYTGNLKAGRNPSFMRNRRGSLMLFFQGKRYRPRSDWNASE